MEHWNKINIGKLNIEILRCAVLRIKIHSSDPPLKVKKFNIEISWPNYSDKVAVSHLMPRYASVSQSDRE